MRARNVHGRSVNVDVVNTGYGILNSECGNVAPRKLFSSAMAFDHKNTLELTKDGNPGLYEPESVRA